MVKLVVGFVAGLFMGYVLGLEIPVKFFFIACLALALAVLLFYLFHLGLRDFQGY